MESSQNVCIPALVSDRLTLGSAASAPGITPHRNRLLVLLDILEEGQGALELPAVDGLRCLAGVLERDAEVGAARAGALCRLDVGRGVADLKFMSERIQL